MEIIGTVKSVSEVETFASGFSKRTLLVETEDRFPQTLPIEFTKENTSKLDNLKEGDNVTVAINLRGSEYNGRHYVNIQGWKVESKGSGQSNSQSSTASPNSVPAQNQAAPSSVEDVLDCPF